MDYNDTVTLTDINSTLSKLGKKIDNIETEVTREDVVIRAHPVLFVILMIGFFITMDFWAAAAHNTLHHFHPRGQLQWWEYIIVALISLGLLLWLGSKSGIRIRMLGED